MKYLSYICTDIYKAMEVVQSSTFTFYDLHCLPEEQIGVHSHDELELSYVIRGKGVRVVGNKMEDFQSGEILLLPSGIQHVWTFNNVDIFPDGCIETISVLFDKKTLETISSIFPEIRDSVDSLLNLHEARRYQRPLQTELANILLSMRHLKPGNRIPLIMDLLLKMSDLSYTTGAGCNVTLTDTEKRLAQVEVYCKCNFNKTLTLESASKFIGMNKSSFCSFIKKHTGHTFSEYLNNIKIKNAVDLLNSASYNIAEVAYLSGFCSVTYFNRVFRNQFGISPSQYRKKLKE